jgi:3-isopropylmalate/(R)-2-methylmalate dehydratase large subunit
VTVVEKIIAAHCGRKRVKAGETLFVACDLAMGSEIIFPQVLNTLNELGWNGNIERDRIALVNGHLVPTREAAAGTLVAALDRFAAQYKIPHYFQAGRSGDCQTLLADNGMVRPGNLLVGSDQHFTTYGAIGTLATGVGGIDLAAIWTTGRMWLTVPPTIKIVVNGRLKPGVLPKDFALTLLGRLGLESAHEKALEFSGEGLASFTMPDRFMICNLAVESGARFAFMPVDNTVSKYLHLKLPLENADMLKSDPDAEFVAEHSFDLGEIVPMVAAPYNPTAGVAVTEIGELHVDQVVIGSCTNGRIEDFRKVAALLQKHELYPGLRLGLYPASHQAVRDIIDEDLALLFTRRGATISPPSCQPCLGSGPSLLGEHEVGVYTTNRNYRGRHGALTAQVYLSGPLVAAASAITGVLTDPRELL